MKVIFDFTPVVKEKYTGFYTFGLNLISAMQSIDNFPELELFYSHRYEEEALNIKNILDPGITFHSYKIKQRWLEKTWKYMKFPSLQTFTGDFDIYHSFFHFMPPTKSKPRILTVHDMRRFVMPNFYTKSKTEHFINSIKEADHIIAVSESTKKDLCDIFNISVTKITAVPLAHDMDVFSMTEKRIDYANKIVNKYFNQDVKYLTAISASDKRKNIYKTVKAFIESDISENYKLVVIGYKPKNDKELSLLLKDENIKRKVFIAGPVEDINAFIAGSQCLIFASLYEGFGMPIINAQELGIPVITSNISSMPEVGGDGALYVDPNNDIDIKTKIEKVINDDKLREHLLRIGKENSSKYSWKNTAKKTINVYENLLNK